MKHSLLAFACAGLAGLAIAGCKPHAPVEASAPDVTAASAAPVAPVASGTTVASPAAAATAAPVTAAATAPALDRKGFAGTFANDGYSITLNPDGTFSLKNGDTTFDGSWTAEIEGTQVRLDPNSKTEADRMFAVVSNDEIRALDAAGRPVEGTLGLQRENSMY